MISLLIINGPNLNMLGIREPHIYGNITLNDIHIECNKLAVDLNIKVDFRQSNYEGQIIDWIQQSIGNFDGIIINPAAYTHSSIAILDAILLSNVPTIEVHITDIYNREEFRKISYISQACIKTITGLGLKGYLDSINFMVETLNKFYCNERN